MSDDDALLRRLGDRARARGDEAFAEARPFDVDASARAILDALEGAPPVGPARPTRRWARLPLLAAPVAAAAALALVVGRGRAPAPAAIAPYVVSVSGHVAASRGEVDSASAHLQATDGAIQEIVLRPQSPVPFPVIARVLVVRDGVARPYDVTPEVSDQGAVRFDATGASLRGASELRVVVAPPAAIDEATARARDPVRSPAGAWVARLPIEKTTDPR